MCDRFLHDPLAAMARRAAIKAPGGVLPRSSRRGILALGVFLSTCAGASPVVIAVSSRVDLRSRNICLGDIASVSGPDATLNAALRSMAIGKAPGPGESLCLQRRTLLHWIQQRYHLQESDVQWMGPSVTSLKLATKPFPGSRVASCALDSLKRSLLDEEIHADVSVTRIPRDVQLVDGRIALECRNPEGTLGSILQDGSCAAHRSVVWVDIRVDGRYVQSVPVSVEITVSESPVEPSVIGEQVAESREELKQLAGGKSSLPRSVSVSPQSRASLQANPSSLTEISDGKPATPYVVHCGDIVTLKSVQGVIMLESPAEVLQDGHLGQHIRVKRAGSSSSITARVSGPEVVEIP